HRRAAAAVEYEPGTDDRNWRSRVHVEEGSYRCPRLKEVEGPHVGGMRVNGCPLRRIVISRLIEIERCAAGRIELPSHDVKGGTDRVLPGAIGGCAEDDRVAVTGIERRELI